MNSARESATRRGRTYMLTRCSCVNDYLTDTHSQTLHLRSTQMLYIRAKSVFRRREARVGPSRD